jgi:hypothetical protein
LTVSWASPGLIKHLPAVPDVDSQGMTRSASRRCAKKPPRYRRVFAAIEAIGQTNDMFAFRTLGISAAEFQRSRITAASCDGYEKVDAIG